LLQRCAHIAYAKQIADEGFDSVHQTSVILENLSKDKILGQISMEEASVAVVGNSFTPPPIDRILNLYDLERVAQATLKESSWGYYSTGSMDEFTKCAPAHRMFCCLILLECLERKHDGHESTEVALSATVTLSEPT
jgi:hypothetical protein